MPDPIFVLIAFAFLLVAARTATVKGARLVFALTVFTVLVSGVNTLNEAVVFEVVTPLEAARAFGGLTLVAAVLAGAAALFAGEAPPDSAWRRARATPLRLVAVAAAYVVAYLVAGTLVFPFVADFYADKPLPEFGPLIAMQLVRGLIYAAAVIALLGAGVRPGPLICGAGLAILGGVAPLAADNPHMPFEVRIPHMIEVSVSNFLFGLFAGWLLRPAPLSASIPRP